MATNVCDMQHFWRRACACTAVCATAFAAAALQPLTGQARTVAPPRACSVRAAALSSVVFMPSLNLGRRAWTGRDWTHHCGAPPP